MSANPIYPKIDSNIPNYIKEEYPVFHKLIIDYFKWLEFDHNFLYTLIHFADDIDVNNEHKPYIDIIKNELGWIYKTKLKIDDRTLIKLLRQLYLSRGSENSFKILFRILFDDEMEITYPRDKLFKLSDNNYIIKHEIITTADNFKNNPKLSLQFLDANILNVNIMGMKSGLSLIVDELYPIVKDNKTYLKLLVNETNNDFLPFERVQIYSEEIGTFTERIFCKLTPKIMNRGFNFKKSDELIIRNLNDSTTEFIVGDIKVDSVSTGGITGIGIDSYVENNIKYYKAGNNYKTGDIVTADDNTGTGFIGKVITTELKQAEINLTIIDGTISELSIVNPGLGYLLPPTITIFDTRIPPRGYGANFKVENIIRNYIGDCKIEYAGNNYTGTSHSITIEPPYGGGIQATAIAEITDGRVSNVIITNRGSNYFSPPAMILNVAGNTSAIITPILMGSVTNIIKLDGGKNYHPDYTTISFDSPDSFQSWAIKPTHSITYIDGRILPTLIDAGYGYDSIPEYVFHNNSIGQDFTITLGLLNSKVTIENYTPGKNYSTDTTLTIDAPINTGRIEYVEVINSGNNFNNFDTTVFNIQSEHGTGAELFAHSENIGQINKLVEIESYWVYNWNSDSIQKFECEINGNTTSDIIIEANSCINRSKRYFENECGLLEINSYLHDSYYYQQFSYLIGSQYPTIYSEEIIADLLHPVGFLKFDSFVSDTTTELNFINQQYFNLIDVLLLNYDIDFHTTFEPFFSIVPDILIISGTTNNDILFGDIENNIIFSINNILDAVYKSNGTSNLRIYDERFNLDLAHFGHRQIRDFDFTHKDLVELAALDAEITT